MPNTDNYLLKKTDLGHVKPGFHELPSQAHIYGKAPQKDQFGARQVVSNWETTKGSKAVQPGKDFVSMNREGVKQGFIDSKKIAEFRKDNQIKLQVKQGKKYVGVSIPHEEFTYGIPNRPSTPIKRVICNTYAQEEEELKRERDAVFAHLKKEAGQKASTPVYEVKKSPKANQNKSEAALSEAFKLAQFKNVESKVKPQLGVNAK